MRNADKYLELRVTLPRKHEIKVIQNLAGSQVAVFDKLLNDNVIDRRGGWDNTQCSVLRKMDLLFLAQEKEAISRPENAPYVSLHLQLVRKCCITYNMHLLAQDQKRVNMVVTLLKYSKEETQEIIQSIDKLYLHARQEFGKEEQAHYDQLLLPLISGQTYDLTALVTDTATLEALLQLSPKVMSSQEMAGMFDILSNSKPPPPTI